MTVTLAKINTIWIVCNRRNIIHVSNKGVYEYISNNETKILTKEEKNSFITLCNKNTLAIKKNNFYLLTNSFVYRIKDVKEIECEEVNRIVLDIGSLVTYKDTKQRLFVVDYTLTKSYFSTVQWIQK